ncbi:hypothetical protein ACFWDG_13395, partial [Peribacillus sp. NPDC060186]
MFNLIDIFENKGSSVPNEYLHYYYFNRDTVRAYQEAGQTRGAFLRDQQRGFYAEAGSINAGLQTATETALQDGLASYERATGRQHYAGPELNLADAVRKLDAATPAPEASAAAAPLLTGDAGKPAEAKPPTTKAERKAAREAAKVAAKGTPSKPAGPK